MGTKTGRTPSPTEWEKGTKAVSSVVKDVTHGGQELVRQGAVVVNKVKEGFNRIKQSMR